MVFKDLSKLIYFIKSSGYQNINIIGCPGTGKTTLSKLLSKEINFRITNIDQLLERYDDLPIVAQLIDDELNEKNIIIDGTYTSLFSKSRINNTQLFILNKASIFKCLYRVVIRNFTKNNLYKNEKLSLKILKVILLFNLKYLKVINQSIPKDKIVKWNGNIN